MDSRGGPGCLPTWLLNGGEEVARQLRLGRSPRKAERRARAHWNFLDHVCVDWFETEDFIFVNGGLAPHLSLPEQPIPVLRWQKLTPAMKPHFSGKTMVCGHTVQPSRRAARSRSCHLHRHRHLFAAGLAHLPRRARRNLLAGESARRDRTLHLDDLEEI